MTTAPTKEPEGKPYNPTEDPNLWAEYEKRKAELSNDLTPQEYLHECVKIATELGI